MMVEHSCVGGVEFESRCNGGVMLSRVVMVEYSFVGRVELSRDVMIE